MSAARGELMHEALEAVTLSPGVAKDGTKNVRPLTGNEAIARGAWEAGVKVAAAYPGTPSTEILETLADYPAEDLHAQWSTNEKVALDVAIGASFAGRRALAAMKHVGLNVAADAFMSQTYIGVNGGLVLAVCDDPGIHSSQNEQDTRIYGALATVPILEPSDAQEALDFTKLAFDLSEDFDTPVIVRATTRLSHTRSAVAIGERHEPPQRPFIEKPSKNVMIPAYARPRHGLVIEREAKLKAYFAESPINRWEEGDTSFGVITAGTCYPYVREVLPDANVLKLGASWPLPDDLLRRYCESVDRIFVVEELEPVIEKEIRALGFEVEGKKFFPRAGELSPELVRAGFEQAGILAPRPQAQRRLDAGTAGASAGAVRRLSAHLGLHGGARDRRARRRRYRLLHARLPRSAARHGYDRVDGLLDRQRRRHGQGRRGEARGRDHRRLDLPACRHSAAHQRGLQPGQHHGDAARQSRDRDDRRPGTSRHRQDAARRAGARRRLRGAGARDRRAMGAQGGQLRPCRHASVACATPSIIAASPC